MYCSGQQGGPDGFEWEKGVQYETSFLYEWMDGKWMLEPDGSWGHAANFLMEQWMNTLSDDELLVENSIKLFPNPAYDTIEISNLNDNAVITLIDLNGRVLKQFNYLPDSRMKLGQIDKGTYLFNIKVNEKLNITKKLIIN